MSKIETLGVTRRDLLKGTAAAGLATAFPMPSFAQGAPLKVGFMLPYTGTYAKLGKFIDEGFRLKVEMLGGKLGGRAIEPLGHEYGVITKASQAPRLTDQGALPGAGGQYGL